MQLCSRTDRVPFPELMPSALAVMESVQDMANIAQKIAFESVDEVDYTTSELWAVFILCHEISDAQPL